MANGIASMDNNFTHYAGSLSNGNIKAVERSSIENFELPRDKEVSSKKFSIEEDCKTDINQLTSSHRENTDQRSDVFPKTSNDFPALREVSNRILSSEDQITNKEEFSTNTLTDSEKQTTDLERQRKTFKKSYTLTSPLNGIAGIKRNQKNLFINKMEILTEHDSDSREDSPIVLGETKGESKSSNDRETSKRDSKHKIVLPLLPVQQSSPRCMLSVCSNHDGRDGREALEAVLYCGACVQTVCYKCAFEKHKDHKVTPVQAAAENIRVKLAEKKRKIENSISQLSTRRKTMEATNDDLRSRIHAQFDHVIQRLRKKEAEVMAEVEKVKQKRATLIHGIQSQQETAWGQIDAVLKTQDDVKMLEEYNGLTVVNFKLSDHSNSSGSPEIGDPFLSKKDTPRATVDFNRVQDEIEKITLHGQDAESSLDGNDVTMLNGISPRQTKKRFIFKLDASTAHSALRVSANHTTVEYIGSERNGVTPRQTNGLSLSTSLAYGSKYQGASLKNGISGRLKRTQFATVIGDSSITQGKQYWEISVNRSMEYRLGVAYKQMQGTKSLADEHNCWALYLSYPDRFSAVHKHHKDYIFIPSHTATQANKVVRIGIFLDYEKGVLSFYNASTAAEKRHLYTFRTFFNRPVWPLLSLRQGKLQILTGLPVPRNLVWKTR